MNRTLVYQIVLLILILIGGSPSSGSTLLVNGAFLSDNSFEYSTPYYRIELSRDPARIHRLSWDPEGKSHWREVARASLEGNSHWISAPFIGIGGFTNHIGQAAERFQQSTTTPEITLENIAIVPGLKADWKFQFANDHFTHALTWKATLPITGIYDMGHQVVSLLGSCGDETAPIRYGDAAGFGQYSQVWEYDLVLRMTYQNGSTSMAANRYLHPQGMVWQNLFTPAGNGILPIGTHAGGKWECRGMTAGDAGVSPPRNHIGDFVHPGKYLKDFFFLKKDSTYHLFYNLGTAGNNQNWDAPGNEDEFGHATSADLKTWQIHDPVLPVIPGTWEGDTVSAPSIVESSGQYHMVYTGFDDNAVGCQRMGLATSMDLFHWTRYPGNPVYVGPSWTNWTAGQWADCRDGHIIRVDDHFLMYTMVTTRTGKGAIAIARSSDLVTWQDLGPAITVDGPPESPTVFERNGIYYLITGSVAAGCYKSSDPESNSWTSIPFQYPTPGFWSGFEVLTEGDRYIAAAFIWKEYGNSIVFWDVDWEGENPVVRY